MKISNIICCINCKGKLKTKGKQLYCSRCKTSFPIEDGIFDFNKKNDKLVEEYQDFTSKGDSYGFGSAPKIVIEGHKRKLQILTNLFKKYNLKNKKVLDVGAGESIPKFIEGCKIGIIQDISKNVLKRSRKSIKKTKSNKFIFITSNQNLPCFSDSIDVVFAGEIIEHVKDPHKFINELHRVLKVGGKLVLTTPNKKAIIFRLTGFEYAKHPHHISLQDYNSLIKILSKKFKIKGIYGFNQSFFHIMDKFIKNKKICRWWAKLFFKRPKYAANLIVECEK